MKKITSIILITAFLLNSVLVDLGWAGGSMSRIRPAEDVKTSAAIEDAFRTDTKIDVGAAFMAAQEKQPVVGAKNFSPLLYSRSSALTILNRSVKLDTRILCLDFHNTVSVYDELAPGIKQLLIEMDKRRVKVWIITSYPEMHIWRFLEKYSIKELVSGVGEGTIKGNWFRSLKDGMRNGLRMDLSENQIAHIGDSVQTDVNEAVKADVAAIGIETVWCDDKILREHGAVAAISGFEDCWMELADFLTGRTSPAADQPSAGSRRQSAKGPTARSSAARIETILVIEDNKAERDALTYYIGRAFSEASILVARDAPQAIELIRKYKRKIDVVVTDYHLVGISLFQQMGPEDQRANSALAVLDEIQKRNLSMPIILHSNALPQGADKQLKQQYGERIEATLSKGIDYESTLGVLRKIDQRLRAPAKRKKTKKSKKKKSRSSAAADQPSANSRRQSAEGPATRASAAEEMPKSEYYAWEQRHKALEEKLGFLETLSRHQLDTSENKFLCRKAYDWLSIYRRLIEEGHIDASRIRRILDIAAGQWYYAQVFSHAFPNFEHAYAIDCNAAHLPSFNRKWAKLFGLDSGIYATRIGDFRNLENIESLQAFVAQNGKYDLVLIQDLRIIFGRRTGLYHVTSYELEDIPKLFFNISRLLNEDGYLVFMIRNSEIVDCPGYNGYTYTGMMRKWLHEVEHVELSDWHIDKGSLIPISPWEEKVVVVSQKELTKFSNILYSRLRKNINNYGRAAHCAERLLELHPGDTGLYYIIGKAWFDICEFVSWHKYGLQKAAWAFLNYLKLDKQKEHRAEAERYLGRIYASSIKTAALGDDFDLGNEDIHDAVADFARGYRPLEWDRQQYDVVQGISKSTKRKFNEYTRLLGRRVDWMTSTDRIIAMLVLQGKLSSLQIADQLGLSTTEVFYVESRFAAGLKDARAEASAGTSSANQLPADSRRQSAEGPTKRTSAAGELVPPNPKDMAELREQVMRVFVDNEMGWVSGDGNFYYSSWKRFARDHSSQYPLLVKLKYVEEHKKPNGFPERESYFRQYYSALANKEFRALCERHYPMLHEYFDYYEKKFMLDQRADSGMEIILQRYFCGHRIGDLTRQIIKAFDAALPLCNAVFDLDPQDRRKLKSGGALEEASLPLSLSDKEKIWQTFKIVTDVFQEEGIPIPKGVKTYYDYHPRASAAASMALPAPAFPGRPSGVYDTIRTISMTLNGA